MANVGEIKARITLDNQAFKKGMDESKQKADEMKKKSADLKKEMGAIQKASGAVALGIGAAIGTAVTVAANFEQAMARVKAISGATDDEFQRLEQTARDLGASTQYSARLNWPAAE